MKHELWYKIYGISGCAAIIFLFITIIFIIRFRFFSLLISAMNRRKKTDISISSTNVSSDKISVRTERIPKIPQENNSRKTGTVIAGMSGVRTGTVIASDNFFITRNIVITGTDSSFIDEIISDIN